MADPVLWAKQVPGQRTHRDNPDGSRSYTDVWSVKTYGEAADGWGATATATAVLASPKLPRRFDPLYVYVPNPLDPWVGSYVVREVAPGVPDIADASVRLTDREARQSPDPTYWEVTLTYEGVNDPTLDPPRVLSDIVEYQEYATHDALGRPVMNSAMDPLDGGMPRDGFFKRITITRNLPYNSWSQKKGDTYAKTLNRNAFFLPGQFDAAGEPEQYGPGQVLIKAVSEERVVRWRGATPTSTTYYWRVSVELLVDLQDVRQPDGKRVDRLHRWVVADAGYKAFLPKPAVPPPPPPPGPPPPPPAEPQVYVKRAVRSGPDVDSSVTLLDGRGRPLLKNNQDFNYTFSPFTLTSLLGGMGADFYATDMNTPLVVAAANGVLQNDTPFLQSVVKVAGSDVGGTATLAPDGGFSFSPLAGFVGWARFQYKPLDPNQGTAPQDVFILVGAVPVTLFFDRYRWRDWSDIAALLEGW